MPKTTTARNIKPGMVVRSTSPINNELSTYRVVASVDKRTPYAERFVSFTDGHVARVGNTYEFQIARGKAERNAAKARATSKPVGALELMFALLGAYATA